MENRKGNVDALEQANGAQEGAHIPTGVAAISSQGSDENWRRNKFPRICISVILETSDWLLLTLSFGFSITV